MNHTSLYARKNMQSGRKSGVKIHAHCLPPVEVKFVKCPHILNALALMTHLELLVLFTPWETH